MFNGNFKPLFTTMVMEAAESGAKTVTTQADSPLVPRLHKPPVSRQYPLLPKSPVSRRYPRCSEGERVRRMSQILLGTLRRENGLARDGQLVSRIDGKLQVRRPY